MSKHTSENEAKTSEEVTNALDPRVEEAPEEFEEYEEYRETFPYRYATGTWLIFIGIGFFIIGFFLEGTTPLSDQNNRYLELSHASYLNMYQTMTVGPFEISDDNKVIELKATLNHLNAVSSTKNYSGFLEVSFLDANKKPVTHFGKEVWYEEGYDEGYYWTEIQNQAEVRLAMPQKEPFYLQFTLNTEDLGSWAVSYDLVQLNSTSWLESRFGWGLLALGFILFAGWVGIGLLAFLGLFLFGIFALW